ncbi:MAG TPA: hypothetical protein VKD23_06805 [Terriglobales bacterium]|nr:hypothetical protein [Terriglobales bacterium]
MARPNRFGTRRNQWGYETENIGLASGFVTFDRFQNIAQCAMGARIMFNAYRGGPVRYGTVSIPKEGQVIIFICALVIFLHGLKHLLM